MKAMHCCARRPASSRSGLRGADAGAVRSSSRSARAASAAPISTSSTASCRMRRSRSCPVTRSSAIVEGLGDRSRISQSAIASAFPWLGYTCGSCDYCRSGRENLCPNARFTGYQIDGGYAQYAVADARLHVQAARSVRRRRGGAAAVRRAHRLPRVSHDGRRPPARGLRIRRGGAHHRAGRRHEGRDVLRVHVARRRGGAAVRAQPGRRVGRSSTEAPPEPLDAAIIFAPVGRLVPEALSRVAPGGTVVCAGIHMSDIPSFPYRHPVGGARRPVGREPDAPGRARVSRAGAERAGQDTRTAL